MRLLADKSHYSFGDAAQIAVELADLEGRPIIARPPGPVERGIRLIRRRPTTFALAVCILALAALVGVVYSRSQAEQRRLQAVALVEAITTADTRALPRLVDRLMARRVRKLYEGEIIRSA